ncbi:hypothetical protein J3459_007686 [Metarhizium acridum]|nr:hypothetical protein J3459_007686 [Metarhizium acridum]
MSGQFGVFDAAMRDSANCTPHTSISNSCLSDFEILQLAVIPCSIPASIWSNHVIHHVCRIKAVAGLLLPPLPRDMTKSCIQSRFVQHVSWSQHGLHFVAPIKSRQSFVETAIWVNWFFQTLSLASSGVWPDATLMIFIQFCPTLVTIKSNRRILQTESSYDKESGTSTS